MAGAWLQRALAARPCRTVGIVRLEEELANVHKRLYISDCC
jgi:hypothetical protein